MSILAALGRRWAVSGARPPATAEELPEEVRRAVPRRFEAVAEALASNRDATGACVVVGREVARDGADLGAALSGLHATYQLIRGQDPDFAAVEALGIAWSEATLEYLHQLSCEDPMTGLASLSHLRTRLDELYREAGQCGVPVSGSHALLVAEMRAAVPGGPEQQFTRALRLVQLGEAIRAVFPGGETLGRAGNDRAIAVVRRTTDLGTAVTSLRLLLDDMRLGGLEVGVWIEGLPTGAAAATRLLDELART